MINKIKRSAFWKGCETPHYFHPSICPCGDGLLMTLQTYLGISDTYGPVMWSFSADAGNSWSDPQEIQAMAHRSFNGITEGIADVRPLFHPQSNTVIAIGCNTYYGKNGYWQCNDVLKNKDFPQFPIYAVRRADGSWSERRELKADFFNDCLNWRVACAQLSVMPDGDVLIPVYFIQTNGDEAFSVCSVKCSFDGEILTVKAVGKVLTSHINRGLIEPSLAVLNGKYYMTIRAEDNQGYFSVSNDGLNWEEVIPWRWDNGEVLTMSTTQQHWVCNGSNLFLVYTRKAGFNDDVMRWRAPLFIARFDEKNDCLLRDSEQEVLPLVRTHGKANTMGNFHAVDISSTKSIVSVGSVTHCIENDKVIDFFSETLLAEILWEF